MPLFPHAEPLLTLALVLLAGVVLGMLAKRVRLPSVTGQIVAGVAIGRFGLHLFDEHAFESLQPITHFALALVAVTVGAHFNLKRLRNAGKRLFLLLLFEAVITPALVVGALLLLPETTPTWALILGALAVETAPVTVIALVRETHSRGVLVKTLVAAVALNNMACIVLFEVARAVVKHDPSAAGGEALLARLAGPAEQLGIAALLGTGVALSMIPVARYVRRQELITTAGAVAILITAGLSGHFGISPLLSCLFLGIAQTNLIADRSKLVDVAFARFEPAILAAFFTLAGVHLDLGQLGNAWLLALVYFAARAAGKLTSAHLAMRLAGATERVRKYLGLAMLPQAGVTIGLLLLVQDDPYFKAMGAELSLATAVVLAAVTLNEIVGPLLAKHALSLAGEAGKDRSRLIDFLQEENIMTDLKAKTMKEAISKLVDLMIQSHHLDNVDREALLETVLKRESESSTCFGGGLAVPHGILPEGHPMVGVMGICREGLAFETPDGRPVHCMVLLGTSPGEHTRHLQVLAALAQNVGRDPGYQARLFNAESPAHASDVLHGDESEDFNTYLKD